MVLIFDYDGTLHNTVGLYGKAFRKGYAWLVEKGYAEDRYYSDEEMSKWLGYNPVDMWSRFMPGLPEETRRHVSEMVGQGMAEGIENGEAVLFPHVTEVMEELKREGHKLVILSNCRKSYMEAHKKAFGLEKWFDDFFPAQAYNYIPKEDIFPFIAKKWPSDKYVMVGDRASDIKVGTANGIPSVGCAYGFGEPEELSDCTYVIDDIRDLPAVVKLIEMLDK